MNEKIKKMTNLAIILAISIALQILTNLFPTQLPINLGLTCIILAAVLYGPLAGLFLGCVNGFIVCFAPSTVALFLPCNAFMTVVLCIGKTGIAGLLSGLAYKYLKINNNFIRVLLASIIVPLVNTGLFTVGSLLFFVPVLESIVGTSAQATSIYSVLFLVFIGFNFFIELALNSILSPTILQISNIFEKKFKK